MEAASADELNVAEVVQKLADELGLQELERMRLQPALVGSRAAPASPAISSAIFALFAGGRVSRTVRSGGRAGCRYMHRLLLDVAAYRHTEEGNRLQVLLHCTEGGDSVPSEGGGGEGAGHPR